MNHARRRSRSSLERSREQSVVQIVQRRHQREPVQILFGSPDNKKIRHAVVFTVTCLLRIDRHAAQGPRRCGFRYSRSFPVNGRTSRNISCCWDRQRNLLRSHGRQVEAHVSFRVISRFFRRQRTERDVELLIPTTLPRCNPRCHAHFRSPSA